MSKRSNPSSTSVEEILQNHRPEVRALVERLRTLILHTVPNAAESANAVWHSLSYRHPHSGYFCGIFPQPDRVDLAFEFGVLLADPNGLLDGDGKQVRYVRLKHALDIRARPLRKLLLAAIALPERRADKLALIRSSAKLVRDQPEQ